MVTWNVISIAHNINQLIYFEPLKTFRDIFFCLHIIIFPLLTGKVILNF